MRDDRFEGLMQSVAYMASRMLPDLTDDDQRIRASGLYLDWTLGSYQVGDIRNAIGQTWECFQSHDTTTYPDIQPGNAAWYTFWRPLHGRTPTTARPWVAPQGSHDMYHTGEYMVYTDGVTYRCLSDTVYTPEEYAQAWEVAE